MATEEMGEALRQAAEGLPFRFEAIDSGERPGAVYIDLIDNDNNDAPYRLILEGPEVHG